MSEGLGAETAGLETGDVITEYKWITCGPGRRMQYVYSYLNELKGDTVILKVRRDSGQRGNPVYTRCICESPWI